MKTSWFLIGIFVLALPILLGSGARPTFANAVPSGENPMLYLPLVPNGRPYAIVVDHRHTNARLIPDDWIARARELVVHYAHTSHGSQVLSGLSWLESRDARFNVDIEASGPVVLPDDGTALRIYDGNNYAGTTYITPELYWESEDGKAHTRSVVATGWFNFSLWTWCGQMSYYEDAAIQEYIDVMDQFESEFPGVRFIYYTGHTDGSTPESQSKLWRHNNSVRQYVQDHQAVLFDFADIESFDPDGNFYPTVSDACEWCSGWCAAHPTNFECQGLPGCAHTHGLQCTLKGQAFWWLMARLAGWDGTPAP